MTVMTVDTNDIDVTNDEAILKNDKCVGYVTSGGYAHHVKKSIAIGYIPVELTNHGESLNIEINGKTYIANVIEKPLYDPDGKKMKS